MPTEALVYDTLQAQYHGRVFKQCDCLKDLYLRYPRTIDVQSKELLFDTPTVLFLLMRSENAIRRYDCANPLEDKPSDTADIIFHADGYFQLIDVKTRNMAKAAQPPNIISAYKVAQMCARMIDNADGGAFDIIYVEADWTEQRAEGTLRCERAHVAELFKARPDTLYINWAAALQLQFHVADLDQSFRGSKEEWARQYLRCFVRSARLRCKKMREEFITPFQKYLTAP